MREAAITAARVNRLAGHYAEPTPASHVMDIIRNIPQALREIMDKDRATVEQSHA